jgi:hypothetical protein
MSSSDLEIGGLQWRKAKRSAGNGACVEVAPANGKLLVRDSKDPDGSVMKYPGPSWRAFVADVREGQFDPGPTLAA